MSGDLEKRISGALSGDGLSSGELSALYNETETAISDADAEAEREREAAFDPALRPDPQAARQAMENASFAANRLRTLLPRVAQRYSDAKVAEDRAVFEREYAAVEARQEKLIERFHATYAPAVAGLIGLFEEIEAVDGEVDRVNHLGAAFSGEERRLRHAPFPLDVVRLPDPRNFGVLAWPPPRPSLAAASVQLMPTIGGMRYSQDWAAVVEEEKRDAEARAAERVAAEEKDAAQRQQRYYQSLASGARA